MSRRAQARPGPTLAERLEKLWRGGFGQRVRRGAGLVVLYSVPAYFVSRFLLNLSGGALWLPSEWRDTVQIFGVTLGLFVFGWMRSRVRVRAAELAAARAAAAGAAPAGKAAELEADREHGHAYRSAILLWLLAVLLLGSYVGLRARTVVYWSPPHFWLEAYSDEPLPPFVDLERGSVYVPLAFSAEMEERFAKYEDAADNVARLDGLSYVLTYAPDELFDWLRRDGAGRLMWTTLLFLLLHLGILASASAALGCTFTPAGALGKLAAHPV